MNRFRWHHVRYTDLLNSTEERAKFPGVSTRGQTLYYEGKPIIREDKVLDYIDKHIKGSDAPLSIEQMFWWLKDRVVGISRRAVAAYFKSQPTYQRLKRRPSGSVGRKKRVEQSTSWVVERYPDAIGIDLLRVPMRMSNWTNLVVVVHRRSNKLYARPIKGAKSQATLTAFKHIMRDIMSQFDTPEICEMDSGSEFKSVFAEYLRRRGIQRRVLKLVPYVEKKNGTLMKYMNYLMDQNMSWSDALPKALTKINNIVSRVTKQRANDVGRYQGVKRERRSIKMNPRPDARRLEEGTQVRYLMPLAGSKAGGTFYKAYNMRNWSAPYPIQKVHKIRQKQEWKYKVNDKWHTEQQIQVVE